MSDFLGGLVVRALAPEPVVRPRISARFEGEGGGEEPGPGDREGALSRGRPPMPLPPEGPEDQPAVARPGARSPAGAAEGATAEASPAAGDGPAGWSREGRREPEQEGREGHRSPAAEAEESLPHRPDGRFASRAPGRGPPEAVPEPPPEVWGSKPLPGGHPPGWSGRERGSGELRGDAAPLSGGDTTAAARDGALRVRTRPAPPAALPLGDGPVPPGGDAGDAGDVGDVREAESPEESGRGEHPGQAPAPPRPAQQEVAPPAAPRVRIHIGRVEVRASAPEAPRPRPPRPQPELTLETYLREREEGRR